MKNLTSGRMGKIAIAAVMDIVSRRGSPYHPQQSAELTAAAERLGISVEELMQFLAAIHRKLGTRYSRAMLPPEPKAKKVSPKPKKRRGRPKKAKTKTQ